MKKLMVLTVAALTAAALTAAPTTTGKKGTSTRGKSAAKAAAVEEDFGSRGNAVIRIERPPRLNRQATFGAPSVDGAKYITGAYTRPRKWIVLETQYSVLNVDFVDHLTFKWHVLLETKTSVLNRSNKEMSPYSYFTTSVTYQNIPDGSHAASVVLPPSYLERYGEPCTVGLEVTDANGMTVAWGCESAGGEVSGFAVDWGFIDPASKKTAPDNFFWRNQNVMTATRSKTDRRPMIEQRQGLKDRSKTIWALVNPNDYEDVAE